MVEHGKFWAQDEEGVVTMQATAGDSEAWVGNENGTSMKTQPMPKRHSGT